MIFSSCYSYNNFLKSQLRMNPHCKTHPRVWIRLEDTLTLMKYLMWKHFRIRKAKELAVWYRIQNSFHSQSPNVAFWRDTDENVRWKSNLVLFLLLSDILCLLFILELAWILRLPSRVQNTKRQILEKVKYWLFLQEICG